MNSMQVMHRAVIGVTAGIVGTGVATGSHMAAEAASKDDANPLVQVGANLGLPLAAVSSIVSVPAAARGGAMPAALLGAVGVGAATGIFTSAFSSIDE